MTILQRAPLYRRATYVTVTRTESSNAWTTDPPDSDLTSNSAAQVWLPVGEVWYGLRPWFGVVIGAICFVAGLLTGHLA